ncbi:bifunctional folylpolyglutamate synthase/dihydrofolate synthase [Amnibacterium kyonggiense]|uniref:tetrahydrofolate synthase n=1 Tax=Amnibacterium kyonggiense TaxID=595671 RepID=A0A4R7FML4_9MICO|nr:folylpolyglutamate synthase/dihydrofolate synthase family protein [Amnibacterium kyonggiense]TDS77666.1 dihydrofolate synthase/folylpolyglutamate synthase [Amnibacterium kyonggiense]
MSDTALDRMLDELYGRVGEKAPQPRLSATRKALELMGDPHRSYPIVHITGTNGKTSTSRLIESILRAHGLRTGLFTSPDLGYLGQRIVVDGEPIAEDDLLAAWAETKPFLELADAQLAETGEPPLTFFEALTVLAYAVFADAPIDVGVIEVGMGGEWDSTNVADGQVAVFTPIDLDHTERLGRTVEEIARTKAGIVKPGRSVVTAAQKPEALTELERAAALSEADVTLEGRDFRVLSRTPAVGGQLVDVQGRAGRYEGLFVPLLGAHQAQNTAVAIAAVETFLGGGDQLITGDVLAEGLAGASSPGRLQVLGGGPLLVVDAAHNPHGVTAMAAGLAESFRLNHVVAVLAVLADKDAEGMIRAAADLVDEFVVTTAPSDRTTDPDELAALVVRVVGADRVVVEPDVARALETARGLAEEHAGQPEADGSADAAAVPPQPGVVVFGSITLVAKAIELVREHGWP